MANPVEERSVELTREHRLVSMERLVKAVPQLYRALLAAELLPAEALDAPLEQLQDTITARSVSDVERILFKDPFCCDVCGEKHPMNSEATNDGVDRPLPGQVRARVCPVDNKPHRRLLIEIANRFLGLVAEARASIVLQQTDPTPMVASPLSPAPSAADRFPSPAAAVAAAAASISATVANDGGQSPLTPASPATNATTSSSGNSSSSNTRPKVRRPLPRKPHLLVLAFHAASKAEVPAAPGSGDEALHRLAVALIMSMVSIFKSVAAAAAASADQQQQHQRKIQRHLIVFDRTWKTYVQLTLMGMAAVSAAPAAAAGNTAAGDISPPAVSTPPKNRGDEHGGGAAGQALTPQRARTPPADRDEIHTAPPLPPKQTAPSVAPAPAAASSGFGGLARGFFSNSAKNAKASSEDRSDGGGGGAGSASDGDGGSSTPEPPIVRPVAPPFSAASRGGSVSTDEESDGDSHHQRSRAAPSAANPFVQLMMQQQRQQQQQLTPEQQHQITMNLLLEQRRRGDEAAAREAYSCRTILRQKNAFQEGGQRIQQLLDTVSEEVESKIFLGELQKRPPNLARIPYLLRRIAETLVAVVPSARVRAQLEREMQDVLDWDLLQKTAAKIDGVERVLRFVVGKVLELGAPAREATLRAELESLATRLQQHQEDPSAVIVDAFRFLKAAVRLLQEDIHRAQMAMVRPELAKRAVGLQRKFLDEWMQPPPSWLPSTKDWVKKFLFQMDDSKQNPGDASDGNNNNSKQQQQQLEQQHQHQHQQQPEWEKVKQSVLAGIVDLLRSSGRGTGPRWGDYPSEMLFFEKPVIFTSANTVQQLVVRMMVVGTARRILSDAASYKNITPQRILQFESKLDAMLQEMLTSQTRRLSISGLKDEVEGELQFFVNSCSSDQLNSSSKNEEASATATASVASNGNSNNNIVMLKPEHVVQLRGVLDQMIDTNSAVYAVFEKKVLKAIASLAQKELEKRARTRGNASEDTTHRIENAEEMKAALGAHVAADVSNVVLDLCDAVETNIAVYSTRLEFMFQHRDAFLLTAAGAGASAVPAAKEQS